MAYSDFSFSQVKKEFQLKINESSELFSNTPEVKVSDALKQMLKFGQLIIVGSRNEKPRSEFLIGPVFYELKTKLANEMHLFSGITFNVDNERNLMGTFDFLISRSTEIVEVNAPLIAVVEAKREDIPSGLGQCLAEMVACQQFNEKEGESIETIYGIVTIGTLWKFLKLRGTQCWLDLSEYHIPNIEKIMGILHYIVKEG